MSGYLELDQLAAAWLLLLVGAALQGAVGFGLGLLANPLLLLLDDRLVPGPILLPIMFFTLLMWHREHGEVQPREVGWAVVGRLPGTALAMVLLALLPRERTALVVGVMILLGVVLSLKGGRVTPTRPTLLAAGVLSGFMGTTAAVGGPPLALLYQHQSGPRLRGTLAAYFTFGSFLSMVALALVDRLNLADLVTGLTLVPGLLAGYLLSNPLAPRVDRQLVRPAVLILSTAAALAALGQALLR